MSAHPLAQIETFKHTSKQWNQLREAANMSNRMEHILQAMPSGVVILNGDGIVTDANPVAVELLEHSLCGARWIDVIHSAFAPQEDDGHEVSLRNGRRVKLAITPLTPEPGQLIVLTDLTETRLLQKNISHLQRLSALGKMVATLAHQVRTPLSAALLYASNLASPKLSDSAKTKFQQKLVDRLNELERQVNDMLLMAKGRQDELGELVSLNDVMVSVIGNCDPIAEQQGCKLSFTDTSSGLLLANSSALSSAINNLVINSLEAGASQIRILATESKDQLMLEVIDNGKGLDAKMQQKVMEPFFTTKAQGTGLGLAVVQSVVRNHGGEIQLRCLPNKGCTVSLVFPRAKSAVVLPLEKPHV
ncbi:sensor histidine kinase [Shewanella putrefaciens]|jgi:two-component system sensor histidine kinase FlrB|uniref:sensor histidine kinase n=1 Tax=Shewanella putrefaciens TaxID=24 RepID=UPI000E012795|nr:ATP-binding protein [Shewanella putrefaciens]MCA1896393.1 PAS domain-containing protein [Shewanella putrefaciens]MDR6963002.1 two-component system sensor histidine kinase FlrB [Shewanella putrefaciens]SUI89350.1 Sensor protein ZraS [Shewanella putrefaciens]